MKASYLMDACEGSARKSEQEAALDPLPGLSPEEMDVLLWRACWYRYEHYIMLMAWMLHEYEPDTIPPPEQIRAALRSLRMRGSRRVLNAGKRNHYYTSNRAAQGQRWPDLTTDELEYIVRYLAIQVWLESQIAESEQ